MSPRALLALLSLFVSSSAVAVARPEATPVGTTSGPTPSGDAVRRADEDAVVLLSSMTVTAVEEEDPGPAHGGEDASEDASRSWYVRCHALASPGETRLAGTLPVMTHHAARRAVVPLGFALGTVSPGNTEKEVLACALFDLLPGVSRARVSRARVPLARFADAGAENAHSLSFFVPRGSRSDDGAVLVTLELRRDAKPSSAADDLPGTSARRDETKKARFAGEEEPARASKPAKPLANDTTRGEADRWRDAFGAASAIALVETCALLIVTYERWCRWTRSRQKKLASRGLRVKRKTSDAPGGPRAGRLPAFSNFFEGAPQTAEKRGDASRARSTPTKAGDKSWTVSPV